MRQKSVLAFLALVLSALLFSSPVPSAEAGEVTLLDAQNARRGPLVLRRPGSYRLSNDLLVRNGADAITITASDVTLDLDGRTISAEDPHTGVGVSIQNARNVSVRNGKIGGFAMNVVVTDSVNVELSGLQIDGLGVAPGLNGPGPSELGIMLVNTRAAYVHDNIISSVNLGIFVRGGGSTGNRIAGNTVVGGGTPANNLLGICYNPAPGGDADAPGPRGDLIYNNHIARFGFAIALSAGSMVNIIRENNLASFEGGFSEPGALTTGGGTNVAEGNIMVTLPGTTLDEP